MGEVLKHQRPGRRLGFAPEPRDTLGRLIGNRGNRVPEDIKRAAEAIVGSELREFGDVRPQTRQLVMVMLRASDKTFRRLRADVRYELCRQAELANGTPKDVTPVAAFRLQLGRSGWTRSPELNEDLVAEIVSYPTIEKAWQVIGHQPGHVLFGTSRTVFYDKVRAVDPSILTALRSGEKAGRATEVAVPLSPVEPFTRLSTDEFDVKIDVDGGVTFHLPDEVSDKSLIRAKFVSIVAPDCDLPVVWALSPTAFNSEQVAALYAEAAIGWERDGVEVYGSADALRCDNASLFTSKEVCTKLAFLGTQPDPTRSYTPESNSIERGHRNYNSYLRQVPGHSRRPAVSSGAQLAEGIINYDELTAAVSAMVDHYRFEHRGPDGKTAWERYKELAAASGDRRRDVTDGQVAQLAFGVRPPGGKSLYATHGRKVRFEGHSYFGAKLADSAVTQVELRRLLTHTDVLYAFDTGGHFLDVLVRDDLLDAALVTELREGMYARNRALLRIMKASAEIRASEGLERATGYPDAADGGFTDLVAKVEQSGLAHLLAALPPEVILRLAAAAAAKATAQTIRTDPDTVTVRPDLPDVPATSGAGLAAADTSKDADPNADVSRVARKASKYDDLFAGELSGDLE